jgi:hypothetical protein
MVAGEAATSPESLLAFTGEKILSRLASRFPNCCRGIEEGLDRSMPEGEAEIQTDGSLGQGDPAVQVGRSPAGEGAGSVVRCSLGAKDEGLTSEMRCVAGAD